MFPPVFECQEQVMSSRFMHDILEVLTISKFSFVDWHLSGEPEEEDFGTHRQAHKRDIFNRSNI